MSTQDHQKQVHKKLHVSSFPLLPPNNACSSRDYNSNVSKLDFHYFAMDSFNKYRLSSLHLTMPKTNSKRSPLRHAVLLLIQDLKIQSYPNCCLNVNVTIFLHVLIRELVSLKNTHCTTETSCHFWQNVFTYSASCSVGVWTDIKCERLKVYM